MEHQNWKTVVLRKNKPNKDKTPHIDPHVSMLKKIEDVEIAELPRPSREMAQKIQQARLEKKLTQKDVDRMCNFAPNTVSKYENCSCVIKQNELNILSRVLGISIRRPKKK